MTNMVMSDAIFKQIVQLFVKMVLCRCHDDEEDDDANQSNDNSDSYNEHNNCEKVRWQ